jgi:hypothetical protein
MSIDAIINIAILSVGAGIEASKEGDSVFLIFIGAIIVHETALVTLRTRTTKEVVIAQLVVIFSFLNSLQRGLVQGNWGI